MKKTFFLLLTLLSFQILKSEIKEYFPNLGIKLESPAFEKEKIELTSLKEMVNFLKKMEKNFPKVEYREMELKDKSYKIPYVLIKKNEREEKGKKDKVTVWIQAMQHGDEQGSGEAALNLVSYFAKDEENYLEKMDIVIVPRINIEGAEKNRSSLNSGIDLNRDHMLLSTSEAKALKKEISLYTPEVILDLHEYPAGVREFDKLPGKKITPYYDVLIGISNNRNAPLNLDDLDRDIFSRIKSNLEKKDIRVNYYYSNLSKREEEIVLTSPLSESRVARNAYSLTPTIFVLLEGRGKGIGMDFFERRVTSLSEISKELVKIIEEKSEEVKKIVQKERERVKDLKEDIVVLESGEESIPDSFKFIALHEGGVKDYNIVLKKDGKDEGGLVRKKPVSYIFSSEKKEILKILDNHGVQYSSLNTRKKILAEEYHLSENKKYYHLIPKESYGEIGDILVELNQVQNRLIMLLFEPESDGSFVSSNVISNKKEQLPFKRVLEI